MCLIVHRPVSERGTVVNLPNKVIEHNRKSNPHGFGLAWRDADGTIHVEKFGPNEFDGFHQLLKAIDKEPVEYTAHFRFATHGRPCKDLSHPFVYEDAEVGTCVVFHNGVIDIATSKDGSESDTSVFVTEVLAELPSKWWESPAIRFVVEGSLGFSRMLIMTGDGKTIFLNKRNGQEREGLWYSTTPLPYTSTVTSRGWEPSRNGTGAWVPTSGPASSTVLASSMVDEDEDDEESMLLLPSGIEDTFETGWFQSGHHITALSEDEDAAGDRTGEAVCDECQTKGWYYVLAGRVFIDVKHVALLGVSDVVDVYHADPVKEPF